jgi:LCP family protein required for cell wall assembly
MLMFALYSTRMVRPLRAFCFPMQDPDSVDFLKPHDDLPAPTMGQMGETDPGSPSPVRVRRLKRRFSIRTKLALFGLAIFVTGGFLLSTGITQTNPDEPTDNLSFLASLKRLVVSGDKAVAGQDTDRVNFLLLGVGGSGHAGPELTDTIIFGSFKPSTKEVGMISIPRDLNVYMPDYGYRKINNVNAFAEMAKRGSGPEATASVVEDVLGEEVHYTVKVDFGGFEEIIDDLGGIDVYVERSFTDTTYPLDDALGSVETVSFTEGWAHMDGATALKFARSRHGSNGEGSDFARAARQQKMLLAVKDKALSLGVLLNPAKLNRVLGTIQDNVDTNLTLWEMMRFVKYIPDVSSESIAMHVLDNRSGLLYDANYNGAYVLLPYEEDWSELHALADTIFEKSPNDPNFTTTAPVSTPTLNVSVEIQNGTGTTGLASQTAQLLEGSGFTVATIGNATDRATPKTVIYDLTDGEKDEELAALKEYLSADVYMSTKGYLAADDVVPDEVLAGTPGVDLVTSSADIDFLIILGEDSTNLVLR